MLSADRRMHDGSNAISLAFTIGQAQEALYRLESGQVLDDEDRECFKTIAEFLHDAHRGFEWAAQVAEGGAPVTLSGTPDHLRAFQIVLGALKGHLRTESLHSLVKSAEQSAEKFASQAAVEAPALAQFAEVLSRLASFAGGQGKEALSSSTAAPRFNSLP